MRASKNYDLIPVLADELEANGFDDARILEKCRRTGYWSGKQTFAQMVVGMAFSDETAAAVKWITHFADDINQTYIGLMNAAETWNRYQDYTRDDSESYKDHWDRFSEFWQHYETLTGETVAEKDSFFTCSC